MRSRRQFAGIALILLSTLAAVGCVDNEALPAATGSLTVSVAVEPAAGVREAPDPPFVWGRGVIASVILEPVDPISMDLYGKWGIQYITSAQSADLVAVTATSLSPVTLSVGTYRLESVAFSSFVWNVEPSDPLLDLGKGRCDATTGVVTCVSFPISMIDQSVSFSPSDDVFVTIPEQGGGSLTIVVDGAALTAAVDSRVTCELGSTVAIITGVLYPNDVAQLVSFR